MKRLLLFCLLLTGCGIGGLPNFKPTKPPGIIVQPDTVYMGAKGWIISHSPNMPANPTDNPSGNGWYFDFPDKDGVHMVMVPYHANKPHTLLTITYRIITISGAPKFVSVDPGSGSPACFRPMLERQGDMMVASQEYYRWWLPHQKLKTATQQDHRVPLIADGKIRTISFVLTAENWHSVFGKVNAPEFDTTMKSLMAVGVSYGGDFAAHGVLNTGGVARFEMIDYKIQ
jgi:hypothetical protein